MSFNKISTIYLDSFKGLSKPIWIIAIAMFINRSGMMVLPFMSLYLREDLGFTYNQVGTVIAFFGVGAALGALLGGYLVEKWGSRAVQILSLLATAVAFIVLERFEDFYWICGMFFITAIITESFRPANMTAITKYSSEENRTRSISLVRLAINLGYSMGPAIGGLVTGLWGFSWIFWLDGGACVLAAIYLHKNLPYVEKISKEIVKNISKKVSYFSLLKGNSWFFGFIVLNTLMMTVFMQFLSSLPLYYREGLHMSEWRIGLILGANGLFIALFEMPFVYVLEQKIKHFKVILIGSFFIGLAFFSLSFGPSILIVIMSMLFLAIGEILQMPFSSGIILRRVKETEISRAMALYSVSFSIAFILAPKISMYIIENYSFDILWYGSFGLTIFTMLGYYLLEKRYTQT